MVGKVQGPLPIWETGGQRDCDKINVDQLDEAGP
jgi:hypothetical protein